MMRARRGLLAAALAVPHLAWASPGPGCAGTVYLTIDTGWGREAERIAAILGRRGVRATLFVADEPTHTGESALSPGWGPFWRARAAEGHVFATHTLRHWYLRGDVGTDQVRYVNRIGPGAELLDRASLCAELAAPIAKLRALAPAAQVLPLWRAPGGIVTPNAIAFAATCGLKHQGWTANGFWGDELDSARHPNASLAARAIERTRPGEVVVLHWGVRSRREPFAEVLEQVISTLQARGICFAPLPPEGVDARPVALTPPRGA